MIADTYGRGDGVVGQPKVWRQCAVAVAVLVGVGLAMGIPSALIANPWFVRMTPAPWWSYAVWVLTAAMSAGLAVTFVGDTSGASPAPGRTGIVANLGSALAVGCPVCNKLVVAALGVSGALNVWAPVQPIVAIASLSLLGWALWRRISARRSCPVGTAAASPTVIDTVPEYEH
ncbi:Uncharacterised protein [Mycobacteroides abscessus subsp. massiliense]|uniref:hypothetical protein n=1 Tax=Mycobacteroides abscessus TaxID=36809 RepID=UPI0009D22CCD|nr:hypothetical protein [Mycobacteroides abscessus]SKK92235.1 Uncharacterised protein [Mycobacteroides abscessus subsp. massiliense]